MTDHLHPAAIVAATLAAVAVIGAFGTYAFVNSGIYDVSATTPDSALVYWATHQTMEHAVAARLSDNVVPVGLDLPATIAQGDALFAANCAVCHGRPGADPSAIAQGLNPKPPDLYRADREPDAQENFQFIKHGIKMTGMPAFGPTQTEDQVWALVAFLNGLPGISEAEFDKARGS